MDRDGKVAGHDLEKKESIIICPFPGRARGLKRQRIRCGNIGVTRKVWPKPPPPSPVLLNSPAPK